MAHFLARHGSAALACAALSAVLYSCGPATRIDDCDGGSCAADRDAAVSTEDSGLPADDAGQGVDAGAGDAGVDAGTEADAGPVDSGVPSNWTWVPVADSACGNGAPTGFAVNPRETSTDLFIYLQGGGACWNTLSCQYAATHIKDGYGAEQFAQDGTTRASAFNRNAPTNPIRDMNFAFVPYCTGDVHTGDAVADYPALGSLPARKVWHKGAKNMQAFLPLLKQTFPNVKRVFLTGSSAGAYGSQYHYAKVAQTWPNAEVHMLADCGQMVNPTGSLLTEWISKWNMVLPADCVGCADDFAKFPAYLHNKFPNRRFGLLAFTQDGTLRQFLGYDPAGFETATRALLTADYEPTSNAKYFLVAGSSHVMFWNLNNLSSNGTTLLDWTRAFIAGDASWASVKP